MIPYFTLSSISVGPVTIQAWGLLVALGILVATYLASRQLRRDGLDSKVAWDIAAWGVIAALVGGRLFHVLFYQPSFYLENPAQILAIWKGGMSIMGGFLGALLAAWAYFARKKLDFWKYVQRLVFFLPLGLAIGRLGCFLIHDHIGVLCQGECRLGVDFPGGARYDHGLLLSLNALLLFIFFHVLKSAGKKVNYAAIFLLWYGAMRFLLDFWRAWEGPGAEARLFGLTPAQYLSVSFVAAGIFLLARGRKRPEAL